MRREKAPDNFSQCRKCGARIIFVRMKSGKSMPVNPNFVNFRRDGGKDRIVLANGEVTSGTIVTDPGEAQGFGYVSHFATCEYAQTFRRKWRKRSKRLQSLSGDFWRSIMIRRLRLLLILEWLQ